MISKVVALISPDCHAVYMTVTEKAETKYFTFNGIKYAVANGQIRDFDSGLFAASLKGDSQLARVAALRGIK